MDRGDIFGQARSSRGQVGLGLTNDEWAQVPWMTCGVLYNLFGAAISCPPGHECGDTLLTATCTYKDGPFRPCSSDTDCDDQWQCSRIEDRDFHRCTPKAKSVIPTTFGPPADAPPDVQPDDVQPSTYVPPVEGKTPGPLPTYTPPVVAPLSKSASAVPVGTLVIGVLAIGGILWLVSKDLKAKPNRRRRRRSSHGS